MTSNCDQPSSLKLRTKAIQILITNACNLTCGGCNQLVGHFPREKIFHVPVTDVRSYIETAISVAKQDWYEPWFPPMHRNLSIYGGEPTLHPEWPTILKMLYEEFADWPFVVLTNGRTFNGKELPQSGDERFDYIKRRRDVKAHDKNIFWRIAPKNMGDFFVPTLIAPIDLLGDPDPATYYEMAKIYCPHYDRCETLIYHGKGYFCVNAGPMDWLFHDGANGWDINHSDHPFQRTDKEVEVQGKLFCHRCQFCIYNHLELREKVAVPLQSIMSKSLVSETNIDRIKVGTGQLVKFHVERTCDKQSASESD